MPYKPIEIEKMLKSKLQMNMEDNDHRWFILQFEGLPPIRTKLSHNNKDIGNALENKICKQLRVKKAFFRELMDCTKYLEHYEQQLRSDPFPPFDHLIV